MYLAGAAEQPGNGIAVSNSLKEAICGFQPDLLRAYHPWLPQDHGRNSGLPTHFCQWPQSWIRYWPLSGRHRPRQGHMLLTVPLTVNAAGMRNASIGSLTPEILTVPIVADNIRLTSRALTSRDGPFPRIRLCALTGSTSTRSNHRPASKGLIERSSWGRKPSTRWRYAQMLIPAYFNTPVSVHEAAQASNKLGATETPTNTNACRLLDSDSRCDSTLQRSSSLVLESIR